MTICSTISLYLKNFFVTESFAIDSPVKYYEIRQNFSNSVYEPSGVIHTTVSEDLNSNCLRKDFEISAFGTGKNNRKF